LVRHGSITLVWLYEQVYDCEVFEDLAVAIETLDIPPGGDALVAAMALRDRLDARIAEAVGAFEAGGRWTRRRR